MDPIGSARDRSTDDLLEQAAHDAGLESEAYYRGARTRFRVVSAILVVSVAAYIAIAHARSAPSWVLALVLIGLVATSVTMDLLLYYRSPRG